MGALAVTPPCAGFREAFARHSRRCCFHAASNHPRWGPPPGAAWGLPGALGGPAWGRWGAWGPGALPAWGAGALGRWGLPGALGPDSLPVHLQRSLCAQSAVRALPFHQALILIPGISSPLRQPKRGSACFPYVVRPLAGQCVQRGQPASLPAPGLSPSRARTPRSARPAAPASAVPTRLRLYFDLVAVVDEAEAADQHDAPLSSSASISRHSEARHRSQC